MPLVKSYEGIAEFFGSRVLRFQKDGCRSGKVGMNCSLMEFEVEQTLGQCHDFDMGVTTLIIKPLN